MNETNWKVLFNNGDINSNWKLFCDKVYDSISKHLPVRKVIANKTKQLPLPKAQKDLLNMKNKLWKINRKLMNHSIESTLIE